MPLITTVRELREFTRDPDANPSGLEPADIVATENRPCGNMVCLPIISPDTDIVLLYGVLLDVEGKPGRGLVAAMSEWRSGRQLPIAA